MASNILDDGSVPMASGWGSNAAIAIGTAVGSYSFEVLKASDDVVKVISQRNVTNPNMMRIYHDRGQGNVANDDICGISFAQDSTSQDEYIKSGIFQLMEDNTSIAGAGIVVRTGGISTNKYHFTKDGGLDLLINDQPLRLGTAHAFQFNYDGTDCIIDCEAGDMQINNNAHGKNIILTAENGDGVGQTYMTVDPDLDSVTVRNLVIPTTEPGTLANGMIWIST
jgi:hypothetical protein